MNWIYRMEKVKGNAQDEQDEQDEQDLQDQKQLQGRLPGFILDFLSIL